MTTPTDKSPREFDLHFLHGSAKVQAKNDVFILNEETIHVIEHAAYLAVKQELADYKRRCSFLANEELEESYQWKAKAIKLQEELDAARAEKSVWIKASENVWRERDELKEQLADANKKIELLRETVDSLLGYVPHEHQMGEQDCTKCKALAIKDDLNLIRVFW